MRADDYYAIFKRAGLVITRLEEELDERALDDLREGFPLHDDWNKRTPERNAVIRFETLLRRDDATA